MKLKNALLIISTTSSIIIATGCSPLQAFHQKSLQVVADIKGVELPAQVENTSDLTFTLDLSSKYERYVSKDLLKISKEIVKEFDEKFKNKQFFTESEIMNLRSLLEPYSYLEEDDFDSQFNDESADYNDKSLYEYINQCFYYLEKQYYSEYIEYLAHVKQLIGQPMTFEHNINSLEHEVVIDFAIMRGSITDPQNVLDEKLNEIKDKYQFKIISTKASNKNPTLIKVTYEYIDSVGNPPIRKTEVYSIAVLDKGNWSFSYIIHPDN
ncbi:hypothetical protein M2444_003576 [Paenibacillus sp. PastF-3]|uniref:hypothetical protein n=1 Tax=unclassified Paenibacillus TaxID=185978 RepID=UPI00247720B9|nr:hypothetical protein [Paenibacillus sp. PastF-3]MDH6371777.1 hypothetical protein [Paenibacillus sp. PastF-3]